MLCSAIILPLKKKKKKKREKGVREERGKAERVWRALTDPVLILNGRGRKRRG